MKYYLLLTMAILTFIPTNAQTTYSQQDVAIDASGNRYLDICSVTEKPTYQQNSVDTVDIGACQGFMLGMIDGMASDGGLKNLGLCIPSGVEMGQLTRVVLKYIRDNPEQAHERTPILVISAIRKAFPCPVVNQ